MDTRKIVKDQFDPIKIKNTYGHSQPIIKTHFSNVKDRIEFLLVKDEANIIRYEIFIENISVAIQSNIYLFVLETDYHVLSMVY